MAVRCNIEGALARVILEVPAKHNAISVAMWRQLRRTFEQLAQAVQVRCIVISGAGGHFCAGADIEEFPAVRHDVDSGRHYHLEVLGPAIEAIRTVPQPTVAAIEGYCIGGGLQIALACDLRIATTDAQLGAPVARIGFPFALPELKPLLALVGPGVAAELLIAGRLLSGAEAQVKGLVQLALPRDDWGAAVERTVQDMLAASPLALRQNKAQIRLLLEQGGVYSQAQLDSSFGFFTSEDYREGVAAFLQKRRPLFSGR
ncbi:MAG: enoyl-CoA hydratase-related protein [Sutterellaceae bacterium]|nr:enoyl-CoA hydratase-related protein [Burkholderiaceae bacterium]MDW8430183.1 enoyl-CoA hydratase-related protein [Sutterellaceae bacterium]